MNYGIRYNTDKPDWEAFGALVLLQACQSLGRSCPEYIENGWVAFDEPVVKEAMSKEIPNSLLSNVSLWLPIPANAIFTATYPTGDEGAISTVSLLNHELEELNRELWNDDEATIYHGGTRNIIYHTYYIPYTVSEEESVKPKKEKLFLGLFIKPKKKETTSKEMFRTEDLAQCAYSIRYQAVRFAEENQVPIILDN